MNQQEMDIVADYLLEKGKEAIGRAGARSVDYIAQFYYGLLIELDEDKAKELYDYYHKVWGS